MGTESLQLDCSQETMPAGNRLSYAQWHLRVILTSFPPPQPDSRSHQTEHPPTETVLPPAFSFAVPLLWLGLGTGEDESCIYENLSSDTAYLDRHLGDVGY